MLIYSLIRCLVNPTACSDMIHSSVGNCQDAVSQHIRLHVCVYTLNHPGDYITGSVQSCFQNSTFVFSKPCSIYHRVYIYDYVLCGYPYIYIYTYIHIYIYIYTYIIYIYIHACMHACMHTVDGRNPSPVGRWSIYPSSPPGGQCRPRFGVSRTSRARLYEFVWEFLVRSDIRH